MGAMPIDRTVADRMHRCRFIMGRCTWFAYRPLVSILWRSLSRRQEQAAEVATGIEIPRARAITANAVRRNRFSRVDIAVHSTFFKGVVREVLRFHHIRRILAQKPIAAVFSNAEGNVRLLRRRGRDAVCPNQNMRPTIHSVGEPARIVDRTRATRRPVLGDQSTCERFPALDAMAQRQDG